MAAAKWLLKVLKDERLHEFLASASTFWQFNLSRAPGWGGQFERIVGIVKKLLYKTVGKIILSLNSNWRKSY